MQAVATLLHTQWTYRLYSAGEDEQGLMIEYGGLSLKFSEAGHVHPET
jgi:hypothetical protein